MKQWISVHEGTYHCGTANVMCMCIRRTLIAELCREKIPRNNPPPKNLFTAHCVHVYVHKGGVVAMLLPPPRPPKKHDSKKQENAPFVSAKNAKSECAQNVHELLHSPSKSGISGPFENILSSADSPRPSDPPYSLHFSGSGLVSCLGMSGVAPARKKNLILEFRNESIDFVNVASAAVCGKTRDDERDEKSIVCTFFLFLSDWSYRLPRINHSYFFIGLLLLHTYLQSSQRGSFDYTRVLCTIPGIYIQYNAFKYIACIFLQFK